ncbi:hypothetical protein CCUS01_09755 [Colletotrichum cuscutae]|uniref:Uncharacterized protein n=1 Tax=Colletotrichum cuscutae TaxID=1209917 RepID=A0AAI9UFU3_9PEZI|nr:hypothetical protein CCUS01_09755 [Colletotrichum cuscutae]
MVWTIQRRESQMEKEKGKSKGKRKGNNRNLQFMIREKGLMISYLCQICHLHVVAGTQPGTESGNLVSGPRYASGLAGDYPPVAPGGGGRACVPKGSTTGRYRRALLSWSLAKSHSEVPGSRDTRRPRAGGAGVFLASSGLDYKAEAGCAALVDFALGSPPQEVKAFEEREEYREASDSETERDVEKVSVRYKYFCREPGLVPRFTLFDFSSPPLSLSLFRRVEEVEKRRASKNAAPGEEKWDMEKKKLKKSRGIRRPKLEGWDGDDGERRRQVPSTEQGRVAQSSNCTFLAAVPAHSTLGKVRKYAEKLGGRNLCKARQWKEKRRLVRRVNGTYKLPQKVPRHICNIGLAESERGSIPPLVGDSTEGIAPWIDGRLGLSLVGLNGSERESCNFSGEKEAARGNKRESGIHTRRVYYEVVAGADAGVLPASNAMKTGTAALSYGPKAPYARRGKVSIPMVDAQGMVGKVRARVSRCKRKPDSSSGPDANEGLDSVDGWKQEIAKVPGLLMHMILLMEMELKMEGTRTGDGDELGPQTGTDGQGKARKKKVKCGGGEGWDSTDTCSKKKQPRDIDLDRYSVWYKRQRHSRGPKGRGGISAVTCNDGRMINVGLDSLFLVCSTVFTVRAELDKVGRILQAVPTLEIPCSLTPCTRISSPSYLSVGMRDLTLAIKGARAYLCRQLDNEHPTTTAIIKEDGFKTGELIGTTEFILDLSLEGKKRKHGNGNVQKNDGTPHGKTQSYKLRRPGRRRLRERKGENRIKDCSIQFLNRGKCELRGPAVYEASYQWAINKVLFSLSLSLWFFFFFLFPSFSLVLSFLRLTDKILLAPSILKIQLRMGIDPEFLINWPSLHGTCCIPGLGPRRVVSGELPMRSCHACRGGADWAFGRAVVAVRGKKVGRYSVLTYLTFLTCIASFQVASPFPSRPIAGSIWKGPQLRRLLLLTCAVSVCLEFLSFADRSRIELEYLPIQSIASSAFILCRATLTRPVTSWLTPLANQLTDCHFASTNSQASTLSRRQVYLSLDSMSPLTAMSTSSLLCIYTQHAWNVSCFLDPTMLELPDASVRDAESLTVNTKENQTRFSGLRTQNAKQEPISLDSRRCTATTTGNGHVWYRSSPRPRCAPTPRRKNNRLSATTTYNISFRLADAAFPIRRRRRSMTGYNLLRRVLFLSAPASDVAKMKDHRAIINLVTHGFQNPWNRLHRCRHCLRCCRGLISARAFGWSESQPNGLHPGPSHRLNSTISCVSRRGHSDGSRSVHLRMYIPDQRTRSGAQAGRPDYPCNSAAWIVLGVMVSGIGRAPNSLWNLPTKSIRPTDSNPPISRHRHRMAQKLRRNAKDSKTQDPFSSLFVPPVALHDLDAVAKSVVFVLSRLFSCAEVIYLTRVNAPRLLVGQSTGGRGVKLWPDTVVRCCVFLLQEMRKLKPRVLLSSSCLHDDGSATPASSHVAAVRKSPRLLIAVSPRPTRNEMSDETSCAIAPTTFQLFTLTWRKALDWEPMEHYQLPHADGRGLRPDLAFLSLAVSSHDLRLTQMLFTRYKMIEPIVVQYCTVNVSPASKFPLLAALQADAFAPIIKTKPSPAGVAIKQAEISPPLSVNVGGRFGYGSSWPSHRVAMTMLNRETGRPPHFDTSDKGVYGRSPRLPAFNVCLSFPSPTRPGSSSTLHIEDRCAALQAHDVEMEQTSFIRHNICTPGILGMPVASLDVVLAQPGADQEHAATVFTNTESVGDSGQVNIYIILHGNGPPFDRTTLTFAIVSRPSYWHGATLLAITCCCYRRLRQGLTTIFSPPLSWPAKVQSTSFVCFSGLEFPCADLHFSYRNILSVFVFFSSEPARPPVLLPAALPTTTDDEMAVSPPGRSASGSNVPTSIMGTRFEMDARAWDELEWGVDTKDLHLMTLWLREKLRDRLEFFFFPPFAFLQLNSPSTAVAKAGGWIWGDTNRSQSRYVQTVPAYHVVRVTKHQLFVRKKKALGRETKGVHGFLFFRFFFFFFFCLHRTLSFLALMAPREGGRAPDRGSDLDSQPPLSAKVGERKRIASMSPSPKILVETGKNLRKLTKSRVQYRRFMSILLSFDLIQQVTKLLVGASPLVPTSITQIFLGDVSRRSKGEGARKSISQRLPEALFQYGVYSPGYESWRSFSNGGLASEREREILREFEDTPPGRAEPDGQCSRPPSISLKKPNKSGLRSKVLPELLEGQTVHGFFESAPNTYKLHHKTIKSRCLITSQVNNVDARLPGHVHTGTQFQKHNVKHQRLTRIQTRRTCLPKRAVIDEDPKTHIYGSGTSVVSHSHTPARLVDGISLAALKFTCKTAIKSGVAIGSLASNTNSIQSRSASFFFFLKVEERLIGIPIVRKERLNGIPWKWLVHTYGRPTGKLAPRQPSHFVITLLPSQESRLHSASCAEMGESRLSNTVPGWGGFINLHSGIVAVKGVENGSQLAFLIVKWPSKLRKRESIPTPGREVRYLAPGNLLYKWKHGNESLRASMMRPKYNIDGTRQRERHPEKYWLRVLLYSRDPAEWEYTTWMPLEIHAHFHHDLGVEVVLDRALLLCAGASANDSGPANPRNRSATGSRFGNPLASRIGEPGQISDAASGRNFTTRLAVTSSSLRRPYPGDKKKEKRRPAEMQRFGSRRRSNVTVAPGSATHTKQSTSSPIIAAGRPGSGCQAVGLDLVPCAVRSYFSGTGRRKSAVSVVLMGRL